MLSAAAAVSTALPPPDAVPIAGLAGLVNARAWYGLTAAIARAAGQIGADRARPPLARAVLAEASPAGPAGGSPTGLARNRPGSRPLAGCPRAMALAAVIAVVIALTRLVFFFGGPAATGQPTGQPWPG